MSLEGIDLILEGEATRVTDRPTLETVASLYREGGWPAEVEGEAFTAPYSAPSAGPPPWDLYRVTFHTVFGVATAEPYGATRWRFFQGSQRPSRAQERVPTSIKTAILSVHSGRDTMPHRGASGDDQWTIGDPAALERHWTNINDQDVVHEIYHEDAVLEFPQGGERLVGLANIRAMRDESVSSLT